jgi:hypothetical protein
MQVSELQLFVSTAKKRIAVVENELHAFLTMALDRDKWLISPSALFMRRKKRTFVPTQREAWWTPDSLDVLEKKHSFFAVK